MLMTASEIAFLVILGPFLLLGLVAILFSYGVMGWLFYKTFKELKK